MKTKHIIIMTILIAGIIQSCTEFLEQPPIGKLSESILDNKEGVRGLLIGAYSQLNEALPLCVTPDQIAPAIMRGGECFKGSDPGDLPFELEFNQYNVTSGNFDVLMGWNNFWDGISKCNQVLQMIPKADDMTESEKVSATAEARFLRGHFYYFLKRAFGNIPWIDETVTDYRVPNTDESGDYVNVWPQIAADFDFARKNLPETQSDLGRPNKWAADCYYAKVIMQRAGDGEYPNGWSEALPILTNAIEYGVTSKGESYDLWPDYHYNFNAEYENGPESVWAVQQSVNDGTPTEGWGGSPNGYFPIRQIGSQSPSGPSLGRGFGFMQPTPWFVDHFRTDPDGLPYLDMYETNPNRLKDDYGMDAAPTPPAIDPFVPDDQGVDPRLDWTVGRRGIPYYDYGNFPGKSWIRNQTHGGPYLTKKRFIWKAQEGTYTAIGNPATALNIDFIRFSEVLLLAAECEARAGSLDNARALVNRVRQRMIDNSESPMNWVKKYVDGTTDEWSTEDAANYRIGIYPNTGLKDPFQTQEGALYAILFERYLELGIEGQAFFDVVRFGMGVEIFNDFLATDKDRFDYLEGHEYTEVPDRLMPIPRAAIDNSQKEGVPTLKQNPGY